MEYAIYKATKAEHARRAKVLRIDNHTPIRLHELLYTGVVLPHLMLAADAMPLKSTDEAKLDGKALEAARWTLSESQYHNDRTD